MTIPLAVAPSNPVPGVYMTVNLLAGAASPGAAAIRGLIMGPKISTGTITPNTQIKAITSEAEIETYAGSGSLPHLAYKALFANDPTAKIDFVAPAESGGANATGTVTVSGTISSNGTVRVTIMGRVIDIPWLVGETVDNWVTKAVTYINRQSRDLFVTASDAVPAGQVLLTAKGKGPAGNDVTLRAIIFEGCTAGSVAVSAAKCAGGTTEPDFTTALATVQGTEYDFVLICGSNADVDAASANNPAKLETHIDTYNVGLDAKLQQGVYGATDSIANAKTGAIGRNSSVLEMLLCINGESLPCEFGGAEMGDRMRRRKLDGNANRIGTALKGLYGSADPVGDNPTEAEAIDALDNGVSIMRYLPDQTMVLMRAITTHSQDTGGNPDRRTFDCNEIDAMYDVSKGIRTTLPQEFPQAKIARDRVEGDEELPTGVVEERDVKGFIVSQIKNYWVPQGYINGTEFQTALDNDQVIVEVNDTDETQVDIYIPMVPYKVLSKFGVYVAKAG